MTIDIYENNLICNKCEKVTRKDNLFENGFKIRIWQCPNCNKIWHHPQDLQAYENFLRLKNKGFKVKLRVVGNSYTISIPKEIISFEEEFQKEINEIINLTLEEPQKLSIFFSKKLEKFIKIK